MTFLCSALPSAARLSSQAGRLSSRDEEETPQTALYQHDATTQMAIMHDIEEETDPEPVAVVAGSGSGEDSEQFLTRSYPVEPEHEHEHEQQQSSTKAMFDHVWELKLRELEVFGAEKGHCCVFQKNREKNSKKEEQLSKNLLSLGVWVKRQRQQQKKGKLSEEVPSN